MNLESLLFIDAHFTVFLKASWEVRHDLKKVETLQVSVGLIERGVSFYLT